MPAFTNIASLLVGGSTVNSNTVTGQLIDSVAVTKTAVSDSYVRNGMVTYIISIANNCEQNLANLTVTDNLGAYSFGENTLYPLTYVEDSLYYFVNGELQEAPLVTAGPPLVIMGIAVPEGGNALLIYQAQVNEFAPPQVDSIIENDVVVTGYCTPETITASEIITAGSEYNLTITKVLEPTVVNENGEITYTFIIQNTGNTAVTAEDNVILSDTFNPVLSLLSVTFNGANWFSPVNYTYNAVTGEFTTVAGQITVPAATFTQNDDGSFEITPGISTLVITGTV